MCACDGEEEEWRQELWSGEDHPEGEEWKKKDKGTELGTLDALPCDWFINSIDSVIYATSRSNEPSCAELSL